MIKKIRYQKILVPIDGSSKSIKAFEYALQFASNYSGSEINLLHIIDKENINQVRSYGKESYGELATRYRKQGEGYINKALQSAKEMNFSLSRIHKKIKEGNPVEEIVEYSKDFDLIIMAARGKKHVIHIMMGHVTERVLNLTKTPILVIP
jgi:nucleotide-binding universal stress UspA family protein